MDADAFDAMVVHPVSELAGEDVGVGSGELVRRAQPRRLIPAAGSGMAHGKALAPEGNADAALASLVFPTDPQQCRSSGVDRPIRG
ncbi:MAG: hypothetical protein BRD57_05585 [Proteobacteria bacterium SW_6_67_9]|nr:MAG: hypothetical protein BRD57_05585 [Proteobacteria bacterium SW_6_67_9]